jgi:hypothetical protein
VEEVLVDGVVGLGLGVDGDAVLLAVVEQVRPALEALDELGVPPRRDAADLGRERLRAHLEADLVVALAGGAVSHELGAVVARDGDLVLRDHGAREARAHEVAALVERVALDGLEHVPGATSGGKKR